MRNVRGGHDPDKAGTGVSRRYKGLPACRLLTRAMEFHSPRERSTARNGCATKTKNAGLKPGATKAYVPAYCGPQMESQRWWAEDRKTKAGPPPHQDERMWGTWGRSPGHGGDPLSRMWKHP